MARAMRRDAARNRDKLLREAAGVFTERGLNGSLEEIARRSGVSIGTLYNHFPTRDALIEALLPPRLAAVDEFAARAAAEPDAWTAFTGFLENLLTQLTTDRGLFEAFTGDHRAAARVAEACERGMAHLSAVLDRAHRAGVVRADAGDEDIVHLLSALSLLGENAGTAAWRRSLHFVLDGLRPGRAPHGPGPTGPGPTGPGADRSTTPAESPAAPAGAAGVQGTHRRLTGP